MVARIIFRNKNDWSTGKHAFHKADTFDAFDAWAKRKAKGREYRIQIMSDEMTRMYENSAVQI